MRKDRFYVELESTCEVLSKRKSSSAAPQLHSSTRVDGIGKGLCFERALLVAFTTSRHVAAAAEWRLEAAAGWQALGAACSLCWLAAFHAATATAAAAHHIGAGGVGGR